MINYSVLQKASDFYESKGYKRIESPWLVSQGISDITKPEGSTTYIIQKDIEPHKQKAFVSSGEQSFLYLINKGFLPKSGRYHTITPCIRNDTFDETHTKYFMKLELIEYSTVGEIYPHYIKNVYDDAFSFFYQNVKNKEMLNIKKINDFSYDINYGEIEIGSYGMRECSFCKWIYGTGLAEPRFSRVTRR